MLPLIGAVAVVVGVGAYLLDDASSSNARARRDYEDACDEADEWLEEKAQKAQRKDALDKLFKIKRAKQEVADAIYAELKQSQKDFKEINKSIKKSKELLSELFTQKKLSDSRAKRRALQEEINLVVASRRELFSTKDMLQQNIKELKERLRVANRETRMVQDEINRV